MKFLLFLQEMGATVLLDLFLLAQYIVNRQFEGVHEDALKFWSLVEHLILLGCKEVLAALRAAHSCLLL